MGFRDEHFDARSRLQTNVKNTWKANCFVTPGFQHNHKFIWKIFCRNLGLVSVCSSYQSEISLSCSARNSFMNSNPPALIQNENLAFMLDCKPTKIIVMRWTFQPQWVLVCKKWTNTKHNRIVFCTNSPAHNVADGARACLESFDVSNISCWRTLCLVGTASFFDVSLEQSSWKITKETRLSSI